MLSQLFQTRKNSSAVIIEKRFRICTSRGARGALMRLCSSMLIHARFFNSRRLFLERGEDAWRAEKGKCRVNRCLGWEMSSRQLTKQEESNYDVSTLALRCHVWWRLTETTRGNSKVIYCCRQPAPFLVACLWTTRNILCNVSRRC